MAVLTDDEISNIFEALNSDDKGVELGNFKYYLKKPSAQIFIEYFKNLDDDYLYVFGLGNNSTTLTSFNNADELKLEDINDILSDTKDRYLVLYGKFKG